MNFYDIIFNTKRAWRKQQMYEVNMVIQDISIPKEAETIKKITPLLKSVLGYSDAEINLMIENYFSRPLAKDLNEQQVKLIAQPFYDISAPIFISEYNNNGTLINAAIPYYYEFFNLAKQSPKSHYYDEPVISREHLVAPDYVPSKPTIELKPQPTTPTITCPYCKSTDCKKISGLSKAGSVALWGIFALGKTTKQWHCNNCKSDF